jgi:hypothetical protein
VKRSAHDDDFVGGLAKTFPGMVRGTADPSAAPDFPVEVSG